jgi:hypothetical protein
LATARRFGGEAATDVVVHDQTRITCTPPDHADGLVEVVVTNLDGTTGALDDVFVYTTLSIDPEEGPIAGETLLTITIGDGSADLEWFPDGHTFWVFVDNRLRALGILADPDLILNPAIGGQLEGTRISGSELTCVTAAQICGPTDVVVVDIDKLATGEPNIAFYLPLGYIYQLNAPVVTDLVPASGAARGGTHVVLTGTFSPTTCDGGGTTVVTFGDVPLTSLGCTVDTITGITGEHDAGVVDVVVINPDGQALTLPGAYTYVNAPTVTAIDPDAGPDTGGTDVTITGADFQDGASVFLRGLDATSVITIADAIDVIVVDDTTITATTTAHPADIVDVVVTNPDGQRGVLEGIAGTDGELVQGYAYEGWWFGDIEPFEDLPGWEYGPSPPFPGWATSRPPARRMAGGCRRRRRRYQSSPAVARRICVAESDRGVCDGIGGVFGARPASPAYRNHPVYAATVPSARRIADSHHDGSLIASRAAAPTAAGTCRWQSAGC